MLSLWPDVGEQESGVMLESGNITTPARDTGAQTVSPDPDTGVGLCLD